MNFGQLQHVLDRGSFQLVAEVGHGVATRSSAALAKWYSMVVAPLQQ